MFDEIMTKIETAIAVLVGLIKAGQRLGADSIVISPRVPLEPRAFFRLRWAASHSLVCRKRSFCPQGVLKH